MERFPDNILKNVFGWVYLWLNIIIGAMLIIIGAVSLISLRSK